MLNRRALTFAAATALVVAASEPLSARTLDASRLTVRPEAAEVTVYVRNDYSREVDVQLVTSSGRRIDLGPVEAMAGHLFTVEESVLEGEGSVRLRVVSPPESRSDLSRPQVSDDTVVSRQFAVQSGTYVELRVGQKLGDSKAWRRNGG